MQKSRSGAGLVCGLNLILALVTAAAVYFGFVRQSARYHEDMWQAVMHIWDNFLDAVTGNASLYEESAYGEPTADEDMRDMNAVYSSFLSDISTKKQREMIEEDRLDGLLSRLDASVRENRYADAREIAREMETVAQQKKGDNRYLYIARSVSRLVENADSQPRYEESLDTLREELGRLNAEREYYRRNFQDAQTEQRFVENTLSLQESNAQIQQLLLETLREQYVKSQEALSETMARLDSGETLAIREARERTQEGYQEGITEARDLLEQSLRIRSRDSRIAFLGEARTRYLSSSAMVKLIDTLLERL
jgi:hypothetical protein